MISGEHEQASYGISRTCGMELYMRMTPRWLMKLGAGHYPLHSRERLSQAKVEPLDSGVADDVRGSYRVDEVNALE